MPPVSCAYTHNIAVNAKDRNTFVCSLLLYVDHENRNVTSLDCSHRPTDIFFSTRHHFVGKNSIAHKAFTYAI